MDSNPDTRRWVVHGRVQGVGFRWYVSRQAQRLALRGWARNLGDGSVEVVAQGPARQLQVMREVLGQGPPGARVDRLDEHETSRALAIPPEFEIR